MEKEKCKTMVSDPGGWHFYRCSRNAKYGEYCGTHSPEKIAERKEKRGPNQYQKEVAREKKLYSDYKDVYAALVTVVEWVGDNRPLSAFDLPYQHAKEVLAKIQTGETNNGTT